MKKIFFSLSTLIFFVSCMHNPIAKLDHIVIICDKEKVYRDTLYLTDKGKDGPYIYETLPVIFGFKNELHEIISPVSTTAFDTIAISTSADYLIVRYCYNPIEAMDFIGKNGDTILINTTGDTPGISVKNRMSWGVNYDWERELRFGRLYDYTPETLVNAESILFLKSMREKFDFNSAKIKVNQAMQNNNGNESLWLDSLYRVNRLDSVEYRYYKTRNHYQRLNMELRHKTKSDLESILSAYSDSMYRNDFYLFYRDYFDAAAKQYYYDKTIQLSNGSDYDFKNAYQRIEQDTLLSGNLRDAHLYYCFRQIDKIFSITDGKKYYDKVVKSIIDTAILNSLHCDYDKLYAHKIQYSNDLALQNRKGVATTLQKVIAANRGKVVYVDFWASWCAPCMDGMPASKQLRNDYKSKDVVFVYLAFNDKDAAWRGAIPKAELDRVEHNYLVTNPRTSAMVEKLKLKTIPRYLLYDKSGHLVNENAPRPESQEIRAALNRYL